MPEWLNILLRSIGSLIVLFFLTKWLEKKQLSEMNVFEYITCFVIGSIVAFVATELDGSVFHGLIAAGVWFVIPFAFELLSLKSKTSRNITQGKVRYLFKTVKLWRTI
ncbi:DUF421 domain-containing protein [Virgibacillus oceani]|uniref:YetF-like N-terminal transmembrane domain-containing protein n=1 Tax=Virgibacillus oceani TaxID=1479511 RepID=A0A917M512_9BACI|nr:hypothetical protein [Virgibacillus oceani]GGG77386.1 hypothetical protein GCM10011398_23100 [Virgibacillus oceani]